jgi:hypothetical protein
MPTAMVEVVAAIVVALSKAPMISPMTAALVMAAVAVEGLTIDVSTAFRPRAAEIAAAARSEATIGTATIVVGEGARAARAAA